jgi:hypothetical protein
LADDWAASKAELKADKMASMMVERMAAWKVC